MYCESNGEGNPVLLVHSATSDHEEWKYQIPELSKSFRVITCDLRGHGDSSKEEPDKFSVELFADDLAGLVKQLGLSTVHLVGHSMGGEVACYFAARHPQRLKTMVLMGEPAGSLASTFVMRAASLMIHFLSPERLARMSASRLFYNVTEEKVEMAVRMATKAGRATVLGDSRVVSRFQLPELSSLSVPTLLVYGETDIFKKHAEKVHAAIPGSRLATIPKAGHEMQIDNPEELNRVLLEFLLAHK